MEKGKSLGNVNEPITEKASEFNNILYRLRSAIDRNIELNQHISNKVDEIRYDESKVDKKSNDELKRLPGLVPELYELIDKLESSNYISEGNLNRLNNLI